MRKQFAPPAIHYKGSGWAKKDRGSGSKTKAAAADKGKDARKEPDGGSSSAKGESSDAPKPSATD
jgi:hypothetical protein